EIQALFEQEYFMAPDSEPRIHLVDYEFSTDRSASPLAGLGRQSANSRRTFLGIVAIDGTEHSIRGTGNGPISSFVDALKTLSINLDVKDYKEHAIGEGKGVKAATYIEVVSSFQPHSVWGVGVHEDTAMASLIAVLNAASAVCHHNDFTVDNNN